MADTHEMSSGTAVSPSGADVQAVRGPATGPHEELPSSTIDAKGPDGWALSLESDSTPFNRALTWPLLVGTATGAGYAVDRLAVSLAESATVALTLTLGAALAVLLGGCLFVVRPTARRRPPGVLLEEAASSQGADR